MKSMDQIDWVSKLIVSQTRSATIRSQPFPKSAKLLSRGLLVYPEVPNPEPDNSVLIDVLLRKKHLYENKDAADIGCGTGALGLVMLLNGAKSVVFSDISHSSIANTIENLNEYGLRRKALVFQSDLFAKHTSTYDFIVFSHPFTVTSKIFSNPVASAFTLERPVFPRFLSEAVDFLSDTGIILGHFFPAGCKDPNDPVTAACVKKMPCRTIVDLNFASFGQSGRYRIYLMKKRRKLPVQPTQPDHF
jgi:SAM-dependent methyltransferase